ncbi:MAG: hypothetical protein HY060_06340 [Proteobacteria bacterium]|nr:hypothetical protein [Pseudomonadota bacterium]
MHKKLALTVFLLAAALVGLSACANHVMPPSSSTGGIGSPNFAAPAPAHQGVPG